MDRSKMISQLEDPSEVFDFLVIGKQSASYLKNRRPCKR